MDTPVAIFLYNRPEKAARVIDAISDRRPSKLYIIADGAKNEEDAIRCDQARATIQDISWDCVVRTCFSDKNLGLGRRVSSGLDWVFSLEERAVILEDDCLPTISFFSFCEELLDFFEHDEKVVHIGGNNFQGRRTTKYSYYFSKYTHIWGWATWRRAWQHFDYEIKDWPTFKKKGQLHHYCPDKLEECYWERIFDTAYRGQSGAWAAQWLFACWKREAIAVVPSVNLVSNIGFDAEGTHTTGGNPAAELPTEDIWQIIHPGQQAIDHEADQFTFDHYLGGNWMRENNTLRARGRRLVGNVKFGISSALTLLGLRR